MPNDFDVFIIGAGPSGTTAASLLKAAGLKVCIAEKAKFPRFVIGESLLPRCMDLLDEAGLLAEVQAQGFLEKHGALFLKGSSSFDLDFSNQWGEGWPYTYQVPRNRFDGVLAEAVQNRGVEIFFENSVKSVAFHDHQARICMEDSAGRTKYVKAGFLLDTSGYGQFLSKLLDLSIDSSLPPRQAIFAHVEGDLRPTGREEGKIWIVAIHEDAWMWIIPFSNGITSVGAVGNPKFFESVPGDLADKLLHSIQLNEKVADRLKSSRFIFPPRAICDYSASVKQLHGSGYALSGNAAGFLDPIFSNGITVAMESSNRAAKAILRQLSGDTVDWHREYDDYVLSGLEVFKAYINAWYDGWLHSIFHHPRKDESTIKQIVSVLSGYVWDSKNPLVRQPGKRLSMILDQIGSEAKA